MKTTLKVAATGAALALLFSGCSSADSANGKTAISFSHWGNNLEAATLESMVKAFESSNADVDIEINWIQSDYEQKLQTSIAGGTQPTVAMISNNTLPGFAGAFETPEIDDSAYYSPNFVKGMTVKGEVKATPFVAKPKAMAVNVGVFKTAGVEVPSGDQPLSVEEFGEIATRVTSGEGDDQVFGSARFWYENWLVTSGGGVYNADGTQCTLDAPIAGEAADFIIAAEADGVSPTQADVEGQDMFDWLSIGRLAMQPDFGPWDIPKLIALDDPNIQLTRVPGLGAPMEVSGLGISSSATEEERKAALAFTEFMSTSPEAQGLLTTAESSLGLPVIEPSLATFEAVAPDLNLAAFVEAATDSVVEAGGVKDPQIRSTLREELTNRTALGVGTEDPAAVLAEFNPTCQSMLDEG